MWKRSVLQKNAGTEQEMNFRVLKPLTMSLSSWESLYQIHNLFSEALSRKSQELNTGLTAGVDFVRDISNKNTKDRLREVYVG